MGIRGIVLLALLVLSLLLAIAWLNRPSHDGFLADVAVNFASEAFGFVLTVFLVNFLLRRHHHETEGRRVAREMLRDIDHAVWVWLGGKREFGLAEAHALLTQVNDTHHPARFTESMLIAAGSHAANVLRTHPQVMDMQPALRQAFESLIPLAGLRDGRPGETLPPTEIAHILLAAEQPLCAAGRVRPPASALPAPTLDASEKAQRWRHSGEA